MKRRKNSKIILGLLIAVIALGIGYAAITGVNLLVNGSTSLKANGDFKVRFVKPLASETAIENPVANAIKISGHNADDSVMNVSEMNASVEDDTHATFGAGELDEVGEYVEFTYTVINESDGIDAILSFDINDVNDTEDYFEVTKSVSKEQIANNETATVTIKVKLVNTPKVEDVEGTFTVTLTATPVEASESESGNGEEIQYDNNPAGPYAVAPTAEETHKGIVYLDPTDLSKTCDEVSSVSLTGTKSGCMKWYVIDDSGENFTVLLDHNITAKVAYDTSWKYNEFENATIKQQFDADTEGWENGLNPRLITANEIARITGNDSWDSATATDYFYFGSNDDTSYKWQSDEQKAKQRSFSWLFDYTNDCESAGCEHNDPNVLGYWTSTLKAETDDYVWHVFRYGNMLAIGVNMANDGIRPVITVPKNIF